MRNSRREGRLQGPGPEPVRAPERCRERSLRGLTRSRSQSRSMRPSGLALMNGSTREARPRRRRAPGSRPPTRSGAPRGRQGGRPDEAEAEPNRRGLHMPRSAGGSLQSAGLDRTDVRSCPRVSPCRPLSSADHISSARRVTTLTCAGRARRSPCHLAVTAFESITRSPDFPGNPNICSVLGPDPITPSNDDRGCGGVFANSARARWPACVRTALRRSHDACGVRTSSDSANGRPACKLATHSPSPAGFSQPQCRFAREITRAKPQSGGGTRNPRARPGSARVGDSAAEAAAVGGRGQPDR
ncbi:hypothetical protein LX12_003536 [Williamsia serinedens]|uniref:Uncharacterized protein n=1 Tax=Williamsia serinedens TaxID=391736 RepID=A0ABT1H513_9NOCA|nr:hypothetical protein [Williamsia serinedens]